MNIPFLDLETLHQSILEEMKEKFEEVVSSNQLILGPELAAFEKEFAEYCGVSHAVGVSDGLEALIMLLEAHGIGEGDEVIVPSNTFIATWLAVTACKAIPVPVEPDLATYNITADTVAKAITTKTKAIIAVHLFGQPADIEKLEELANSTGVLVFEDAAQAHGAKTQSGRTVGSFGSGAAFSFYPGKNLGALGDGGAITTNSAEVADFVRRRRNYGSIEKYVHEIPGRNSRLDELQAAFLRVKLMRLNGWNERRRSIAAYYLDTINTDEVVLPQKPMGHVPVHHLFVVCARERDRLQSFLHERGVGTGVHYPVPPHKQMCYKEYASIHLPIAERLSQQMLSIPIGPTMSDAQVAYVAETINSFKP
ncbi:DegT/DnrJ/EryC1/StrS family aminotransferase [Tianweitania sp.]|uniref:DegT/DnrJ/EryC1/StrS family aminotransferase n=1 Tax=Tianweitania sp. TaxID=2021634 RepID=UPI00289BC375|nr:DegT/DnrJ/EryC1/StrS family aminotransferase [Tianweitania sp.]